MALVHHFFLSFLILLMVLHPRTANYVPQKSQEAADSLADSLAAWQKDGLEPLDEPGAYFEAKGVQKSSGIKHMQNPIAVPPKSEEEQRNKAGEFPQTDAKHPEMVGETTKQTPKAKEHIESIFCNGTDCLTGIVLVLVALPAGVLLCCLAICWCCEARRRLSGDQQERTGLITGTESQTSSPEPALPLQ